ncbi:hypothetical protein NKG94_07620 [Micromonospora sp. M12]
MTVVGAGTAMVLLDPLLFGVTPARVALGWASPSPSPGGCGRWPVSLRSGSAR